MTQYYVYILKCSNGSYYTGYTGNLAKRMEDHNRGIASRYTRARRPVKLVYLEEHATRAGAMRREREIKRFARREKSGLIEAQG